MLKFVLRRLTFSLPVIFGIMIVTFTLARAIPGDPCLAVLGERATPEICDAYFRRNGLDQPVPLQLAISIVTILGPGLTNALLGITITFIPQYARLSRASALSIKEREFVVAEQAIGASPWRIVLASMRAKTRIRQSRGRG